MNMIRALLVIVWIEWPQTPKRGAFYGCTAAGTPKLYPPIW